MHWNELSIKRRANQNFHRFSFMMALREQVLNIYADRFNEYFTEIGPKLARSVYMQQKLHLIHIIKLIARPHSISLTQIRIIPKKTRPEWNQYCDRFQLSKLLKEIQHVISRPLNTLINQSLYADIFPDKFKRNWYTSTRMMIMNSVLYHNSIKKIQTACL